MTTGLCRLAAYEALAQQLDGTEPSGEACDRPATHTVTVQRDGDGITVRVEVQVCLRHDVTLGAVPGYVKSIRLRTWPRARRRPPWPPIPTPAGFPIAPGTPGTRPGRETGISRPGPTKASLLKGPPDMTFTTTTYGSAAYESHRLRHSRRRFWAAVAVALTFIAAVACGTPAPDTKPARAATAETSTAALGDGQHLVGTGIRPGTYTTTAPAGTLGCYWARVSGFDGQRGSIIANSNIPVGETGQVEVKASDAAVEFVGGCTWKRVP